jgi:hypothetical protein
MEPKVRFRLESGPSGEVRRTASDPEQTFMASPADCLAAWERTFAPTSYTRSGRLKQKPKSEAAGIFRKPTSCQEADAWAPPATTL